MTAPGHVTGTAQGEAANVAGTAKDEAATVASTAKDEAANVAGTAKAEASHVVGETVDQVRELTGQVREQATQQLSTQSEEHAQDGRHLPLGPEMRSQKLSNPLSQSAPVRPLALLCRHFEAKQMLWFPRREA